MTNRLMRTATKQALFSHYRASALTTSAKAQTAEQLDAKWVFE